MISSLPPLALPDKVYFRIGEVAKLLDVKPHVVRFWQQQFPTVRPERSRSGRFLYTKSTVGRLHLIKHLLYTEGYTIPGARKSLRSSTRRTVRPSSVKTKPSAIEPTSTGSESPAPPLSTVATQTTAQVDAKAVAQVAQIAELTDAAAESVSRYDALQQRHDQAKAALQACESSVLAETQRRVVAEDRVRELSLSLTETLAVLRALSASDGTSNP